MKTPVRTPAKPLRDGYKWEMLTLLCLAFFFHQGDRAIYGVVLPQISVDLQLTESQAGLVGTVLFITLAVLMPFAGLVGDRLPKARVITVCLLFWSAATMFTGLAGGVVTLVLLRSVATAGGESFYAPSAYSLLAKFHHTTRSLAMSMHQAALYIGVMTSGFIGGAIAEQWGWRHAFYIYGSGGILLGIVFVFRLRDTQGSGTQVSGTQDSGTGCQPVSPKSGTGSLPVGLGSTGILPVSPSSTGVSPVNPSSTGSLPVGLRSTGVSPVSPSSTKHRQDADATRPQSHGQDARATQPQPQFHGQDARATQSQPQSHGLAARATSSSSPEPAAGFLQSFGMFFRVPTALLLTCGFTAIVCVNNSYVVFAPKLLLEKFPSLPLTLAAGYAMFFHHLAAFAGVIAGGVLSDRLVRSRPTARLELQITSMALGAPAIVWMGLAPGLVSVCAAMTIFGLLRGLYECNTHASLFDVIAPRHRATAVAVMTMLGFLLGSLTPWALGKVKDLLPAGGFSLGFASMGLLWLLGAIALAVARLRTFRRDRIALS